MADTSKDYLDRIKALKQITVDLENQRALALAMKDIDSAKARQEEINLHTAQMQTEQMRLQEELRNGNLKLTKDEKRELDGIQKSQKGINEELKKENLARKALIGTLNEFNRQIKIGWQYLQQSDKTIKSTILNLGMSGVKAETMRMSFEQSAGQVARLGGSLEDIQGIMSGYAEETGRARALSADMVKDINLIAKGTGIGIEQASKLGAQFELMGFDARTTMDYVQGVVDTSERMGVNTQKVVKNISDNFKKLNTYTFQQGAKGFAQMAMYAEKMKIDMNDALNAAKVAKSLEGAIDLAAQLQVMGGEFAKTDPFEMLFLSRNDPAKFTEKIADMTKGVVSFRKMSDGTFEKFISPADRDRLRQVAESLGMEESALTEIAQRTAEIGKMRQQMVGTGLSAKDKEVVEGMAVFNKNTGKFAVQIGKVSKDISEIGASDMKLLTKQSVSLKQRAVDAQNFEDAFKATIESLKAALLPILHGINRVLTKVQPVVDGISKIAGSSGGWAKAGGILIAAGLAWKAITFGLNTAATNLMRGGGLSRFGGHVIGGKSPIGDATAPMSSGRRAAGRNAGKGMMRGGAGIGVAAAGIGAGIGVAAVGIGELAKAIKDVDVDKLKKMNATIAILGGTMAAILIPALFVLATAGNAAAPALLAFGGAALMVGAGIGVAAFGIGKMAEGLSLMFDASKGAGKDMLMISAGVLGLAGALAIFSNPITLAGLGLFGATMAVVVGASLATAHVANSFAKMGVAMKGTKDDFIAAQTAIEGISKANFKGGGMLGELAKLLKSPLKVEFSDKKVAVVSDVVLNINGQKFHEAVGTTAHVTNDTDYIKSGKATLFRR